MLSLVSLCKGSVEAAIDSTNGAIRPPNGTYNYEIIDSGSVIGRSTVSVALDDGAVTVTENATEGALNVIAQTRFDAFTLGERGYSADFLTAGASSHATISLGLRSATVRIVDRTAEIKADPTAQYLLISDSLAGTSFLLPAVLHASGVTRYTLVSLRSPKGIVSRVVANASPTRPASVPPSDASVVVDAGGLQEIFWYDPATYVLDYIDVPSQRFALRRTVGEQSPAPIVSPGHLR